MSRFSTFHFLLLLVLFPQVFTETLQERLDQLKEHPRQRLQQDIIVGSDAIAGPRSLLEVGTLAGRPIKTRQRNVYIDNQGVPVPIPPDSG